MKTHPAADLFPLMEGQDFADLAEDIKTNGLHEPIVRLNGAILDGRNRFRACEAAGVRPSFVDYDDEEIPDPLAFVVSANLRRRHLDVGQRAMVAARMATYSVGRPRVRSDDVTDGEEKPSDEIGSREPISTERAAEVLDVSQASVKRAKEVLASGTPELVQAVEQGAIPVKVAAEVSDLPAAKQKQVVQEVESGARPREAVKKAKREKQESPPPKKAEKPIPDQVLNLGSPELLKLVRAGVVPHKVALRIVRSYPIEQQCEPCMFIDCEADKEDGLSPAEALDAFEASVQESTDRLVDALGVPVPGDIEPAWRAILARQADAARLFRRLAGMVAEVASMRCGEAYADVLEHRHVQGDAEEVIRLRSADLHSAEAALKGAMPYAAVCPRCALEREERSSSECRSCQGRGYVTRRQWRGCSEVEQYAAAKLTGGTLP